MKKINIIGTSGSGKSTFARALADKLSITYIEMDAVFWQPNWQELPNEIFLERLSQKINVNNWVLDGNYSRTQALKWENADTIIWLDYGFWRTFYQVFIRSIKRAWTKKEIWPNTGNSESFYKTFCQKESIILWMITNYHRNKRKYQILKNSKQLEGINFIHLTCPKQAQTLLSEIQSL